MRTWLGQSAYGCRGSAVHGVETEPGPSLISHLVSGHFTPFSPTRGQGPGGGEGRRSPSTLAFLEGPRPALASSSLKLVYILRGGVLLRVMDSDLPFGSLFHKLAPPGPGEGQRPSPTRPFPGRALHRHSASSAGRADVGVLRSFSWMDRKHSRQASPLAIFTSQSPEHRGSAPPVPVTSDPPPWPSRRKGCPGCGGGAGRWVLGGKGSPLQPPPCPPFFPRLVGTFPMGLEPRRVL